jgi:hypothetical protein
MREWRKQVRVGGRTREIGGELIWRITSKNFMCHCVMNVLTVEIIIGEDTRCKITTTKKW